MTPFSPRLIQGPHPCPGGTDQGRDQHHSANKCTYRRVLDQLLLERPRFWEVEVVERRGDDAHQEQCQPEPPASLYDALKDSKKRLHVPCPRGGLFYLAALCLSGRSPAEISTQFRPKTQQAWYTRTIRQLQAGVGKWLKSRHFSSLA